MTTSRDAGSGTDLTARLSDPGFTPSVRVLGGLLEVICGGDEPAAKLAEKGVLRIEAQHAARVARTIADRARAATKPGRGRLTLLAGRLAREDRDPDAVLIAWLLAALADDDVKTRRAAARGLGAMRRSPEIEAALAQAFDEAHDEPDRKALAQALGKIGGERARERLAGSPHVRASVIVEREAAREQPAHVDPSRSLRRPLRIRFHTRSGLEEILKDELGDAFGEPHLVAPGVVEATLEGALSRALRIRTATHVGIVLEPIASDPAGDPADDIVRALTAPSSLAIFRTFTATKAPAPVRFRLAVARGGHHRSLVWRCAELVRARTPELINDPKDSTWEVVVDGLHTRELGARSRTRSAHHLDLELVPRDYPDERFAYRRELVAASSHPTIAAALARVAPRGDDDVVWDPFVGAGAELVERALLGPYARLIGTDVDERAVLAARSNLERAGVARASIEHVDACAYAPEGSATRRGVNVILTNPPMGRRVERGTHADLLARFVAHAAKILVPGGALVWIVPEPRRIREVAESAGLRRERGVSVDMGGFSAELSVYVKGRRP